MVRPRSSNVAEWQTMTDKVELLLLAKKCRSLASQSEDESTARSLSRLADDYEMKAKAVEHLNGVRLRGQAMQRQGAPQAAG